MGTIMIFGIFIAVLHIVRFPTEKKLFNLAATKNVYLTFTSVFFAPMLIAYDSLSCNARSILFVGWLYQRYFVIRFFVAKSFTFDVLEQWPKTRLVVKVLANWIDPVLLTIFAVYVLVFNYTVRGLEKGTVHGRETCVYTVEHHNQNNAFNSVLNLTHIIDIVVAVVCIMLTFMPLSWASRDVMGVVQWNALLACLSIASTYTVLAIYQFYTAEYQKSDFDTGITLFGFDVLFTFFCVCALYSPGYYRKATMILFSIKESPSFSKDGSDDTGKVVSGPQNYSKDRGAHRPLQSSQKDSGWESKGNKQVSCSIAEEV